MNRTLLAAFVVIGISCVTIVTAYTQDLTPLPPGQPQPAPYNARAGITDAGAKAKLVAKWLYDPLPQVEFDQRVMYRVTTTTYKTLAIEQASTPDATTDTGWLSVPLSEGEAGTITSTVPAGGGVQVEAAVPLTDGRINHVAVEWKVSGKVGETPFSWPLYRTARITRGRVFSGGAAGGNKPPVMVKPSVLLPKAAVDDLAKPVPVEAPPRP